MMKVLVIDDYMEHVDTLVSTLNMYGQDARGASTYVEAESVLKDWKPDLVICDGLMTGKRAWAIGYEYLKFLYEESLIPGDEKIHRPYMVALTGFGSTLQRRLCEECGYDEYVTKPIELATLLGWVQKAKGLIENPKQ